MDYQEFSLLCIDRGIDPDLAINNDKVKYVLDEIKTNAFGACDNTLFRLLRIKLQMVLDAIKGSREETIQSLVDDVISWMADQDVLSTPYHKYDSDEYYDFLDACTITMESRGVGFDLFTSEELVRAVQLRYTADHFDQDLNLDTMKY